MSDPAPHLNSGPLGRGADAADQEARAADHAALAHALVNTANALVVALDGDGEVVEFNRIGQRVTGYTVEELAGQGWFEVICPRDRYPELWAELSRNNGDTLPRMFQSPVLTKSGGERFVQWRNLMLDAEEGRIKTISIGQDVTVERLVDRALSDTLALLRSIVETAPSAISAKDLTGRYTLINSLAAQFLGKSRAEILGKTDAELFSPEVAAEYAACDRRVIETGKILVSHEEDAPSVNGAWRYRLVTKGPVLDEAGTIAGVFSITSDLTDSLFAEKKIAATARENELLARMAMALIGCTSEDEVFDVVVDFFGTLLPEAVVIVNQMSDDGECFMTRHVCGVDDSQLLQAARLIGFDVVGRRFAVTPEYRRDFFSASLTKVEGGFPALAGAEVPPPVSATLEKVFGLHDTFTIGILSESAEFGCVHILTRSADVEMPFRTIDSFVRQCVLALTSIARSHEIAEYQLRLEALLAEREENVLSLAAALGSVIDVVSRTVEMRDPYTAGHQRRVAQLAERIARECGMSEADVDDIRVAALMHDMGKVSIPTEILSKPGSLTAVESALVKSHAAAGYEIVQVTNLRAPIAEIIYQHHERCDRSGYPRGLTSDEIHPGAKVLMVADVVEAMASNRPYRPAIGIAAAEAEILRNAGVLYDQHAVDCCVAVIRGGFEFEDGASK